MKSFVRSRLEPCSLLLPPSRENAVGFAFPEILEKEVSRGLTWRGRACSDFALKEHEVNRKGKYCKHFGFCFLPL